MTIRKTLMTIAAVSMIAPAIAYAGDTAPNADAFTVKKTTDYRVKESVKAFNAGDFARSIEYSNRALDAGLSKKRQAIAQSNLCAAEAALGNMDAAAEACDTALDLRPGYEPAESNKSALTVMLAAK